MTPLISPWLLPLALMGEVSFFSGLTGGPGDVLVVDETGASVPVLAQDLAGITLLPIEASGRTQLEQLDPERPRLRSDVPGASRLVLPAGQGSLYRYRRDELVGVSFGFFLVDADGVAGDLFQRLGTGAAASEDPFVDRVAVAPGGGAFVVATTPAAGGDLWEVRLDGSAENRTTASAPRDFAGGGLWLGATWGVGSGPAGTLRFSRTPGAQASLLGFPGAPTWFGGEVVPSRSGATLVTAAGSGPSSAWLFSFTENGVVVQRSSTPASFSGAGYLPETAFGPLMAVDDSGSVAWRAVEATSNEAYIGVGGADVHVTNNVDYLDTVDQAGVLGFVGPNALLFAVGELEGQGGIEGIDLYAANTAAGNPSVINLTQTNGAATAPFGLKSELNPECGLFAIPDTSWVVLHDSQSSGEGDVFALNASTGSFVTVLPDVKSLNTIEFAGGWILLSVERSGGAKPQELWRLDAATLTPVLLATAPNFVEFVRPALRSDGKVALVIRVGDFEWLARVDLPTGTAQMLLPFPLTYGPTLMFTSAGALALTAGPVGFPLWPLIWADAGPATQPLPGPTQGFLLPGA